MIITSHAIDQYMRRIRADMTYANTKAYLEKASRTASRLPERTPSGEEQWAIEDAVLVCKYDRQDRDWIAVTIIPKIVYVPDHLLDAITVADTFASGSEVEPILPAIAPKQARTRLYPLAPQDADKNSWRQIAGKGPASMPNQDEALIWIAETEQRLEEVRILPDCPSEVKVKAEEKLQARLDQLRTRLVLSER